VPHPDLYIYLVQGPVRESDTGVLGNSFLGNWVEDDTSFLFFSEPARERVEQLVLNGPHLTFVEDHHFTYEEWQGGWFDTVKADPFLIVTPWSGEEGGGEGIRIILDPGVVFGNGLHPTTRDCLRAILFAWKNRPVKRVIDLGTGTGILALAAARLGAGCVLAVDMNPLCVQTATRNAGLNRLEDRIRVIEGRAEDILTEPADLVVANLHHAVVQTILAGRRFEAGEMLAISGQMRSQYRDIKRLLRRHRFSILQEWDHEMTWYTVLAERG
jgi:ribosomal protein L11 methyltransferase